MITFMFGGKDVKLPNCVYKFSPFKDGDLKRFAAAVARSCETILKKDMHGIVISEEIANDSMMIAVEETEIEKVDTVWDRLKAFFLLARDANLEITVTSYQSNKGEDLVRELVKT